MKKSKKLTLTHQRKIMLTIAALLLVVAGIAVKTYYIDGYNKAADLAAVAPIRELILNSAEQTKVPAVVDPKTGDQYFPEVKLFLPATVPQAQRLTYNVVSGQDKTEVSVSSKSAISGAATALYQANNVEEMFKGVPKLQACQRGVSLRYAPFGQGDIGGNTLHHTTQLNNGKTLYIYAEDCAELRSIADALKNIRAY